MRGCSVEEMRRPLGKVDGIDPARSNQRPINVMLDHPLERPGLRPLPQIKTGVEIEAVFGLNVRPNEGGVCNALGIIDDIGQLALGRGRRHRPLLAIAKPGHFQLDFGLGHERADFRQAESGAKSVEGDHARLPIARNRA